MVYISYLTFSAAFKPATHDTETCFVARSATWCYGFSGKSVSYSVLSFPVY